MCSQTAQCDGLSWLITLVKLSVLWSSSLSYGSSFLPKQNPVSHFKHKLTQYLKIIRHFCNTVRTSGTSGVDSSSRWSNISFSVLRSNWTVLINTSHNNRFRTSHVLMFCLSSCQKYKVYCQKPANSHIREAGTRERLAKKKLNVYKRSNLMRIIFLSVI